VTGRALIAQLRDSRQLRLAVSLLAVPAILIGLLAMHVLTGIGMSNSGGSPELTSHHLIAAQSVPGSHDIMAAETGTSMPAPTGDCGGLCGPTHDMLGMICVLALLVTLVLVALRLILIAWEHLRRVVGELAAKAAATAPPKPPSLLVLSISRT
jgi:hypothetical protein